MSFRTNPLENNPARKENSMKKIAVDQLCVEVTRRCNMSCMHCMRGQAQNVDMDFETFKKMMDVTESINTLTFTGGEPSLNVPLMKKALDYVKEKEIPVYNIFIATNGKQMTNDFVECYLLWVGYCSCFDYGNEYTNISLSKDAFHEDIPHENKEWIKRLPYYSSQKETDFKKYPVFLIGRAADNKSYFKENGYRVYQKENFYDAPFESFEDTFYFGELYLSSDGNILPVCDFAFKDTEKFSIGSVQDIQKFLDDLEAAKEDGYLTSKGGKNNGEKPDH